MYGGGEHESESESRMMQNDEEDEEGSCSFKSWAKQTEESYQLQLALALRISSSSAQSNHLLDFEPTSSASSDSPQSLSHRFWVNGCLQYSDKVVDEFYLIHGMDVYTWTISTDMQNVPSFESLMSVKPCDNSSIVVVAIDKSRDPGLRELQSGVLTLSSNWITIKDATHQLANLVCSIDEEEYEKKGGKSVKP